MVQLVQLSLELFYAVLLLLHTLFEHPLSLFQVHQQSVEVVLELTQFFLRQILVQLPHHRLDLVYLHLEVVVLVR